MICDSTFNILLNVENIAKTILVALVVSISTFRKDHSVLKKTMGYLNSYYGASLNRIELRAFQEVPTIVRGI